MGIRWLEMVSAEEQRRREREYERRMLPLGTPQREKEIELLRQVIQTKSPDEQLLYQLFTAKEVFLDPDEETRTAQLQKWRTSRLIKPFCEQDKKVFLALALWESADFSLEDFPTPQELTQLAEQLLR